MQAIYKAYDDRMDYTPVGAIAAGEVVPLTTFCGVATSPIAAGAAGSLALRGVFQFNVLAGSGSGSGADDTVGKKAYWDNTNKVATDISAGNTPLGIFIPSSTPTTTDTTALVWLRPV